MVDGPETDGGRDGASGGALAHERRITSGLRAAAWRLRVELLVLVPKLSETDPVRTPEPMFERLFGKKSERVATRRALTAPSSAVASNR